MPLAFSPFHSWFLIPLALYFVFRQLMSQQTWQHAFFQGWLFCFGFCLSDYLWLSHFSWSFYPNDLKTFWFLLLVVNLVIPIYYSLSFGLFYFAKYKNIVLNALLLWPSTWVAGELLRAKFLGGFPYLLLGFASIDSPFKNLIPYLGCFGMSFLLVSFAGAIYLFFHQKRIWGIGWLMLWSVLALFANFFHWTEPVGARISTALIQGNIDYESAQAPDFSKALLIYTTLSAPYLHQAFPLIVWPETALSTDVRNLNILTNGLNEYGKKFQSSFLIGATQTQQKKDYGLAILLGKNRGEYQKSHVLPVVDYKGYDPKPQPLLTLNAYKFKVLICYEIFYAEVIRQQLDQAAWLIVLANDNSFKYTIEPWQQLQATRFFAKAIGRQILTCTNDGITASINAKGEVEKALLQYTRSGLVVTLQPLSGLTPWAWYGDGPVMFLILLCCVLGLMKRVCCAE